MQFLLSIAMLLLIGSLFGEERKTKGLIGPRTSSLVLLGAFMFTYMCGSLEEGPARIIGQITTGISFLCAGLIFKSDSKEIHNLTTAVFVWCLAAIGCMIGLGLFVEVAVLTIIVYTILTHYKRKWIGLHLKENLQLKILKSF